MKILILYAILATLTLDAYVPHDAYESNNVRYIYDGHYYIAVGYYHDPQCPECKKNDKDLKDTRLLESAYTDCLKMVLENE